MKSVKDIIKKNNISGIFLFQGDPNINYFIDSENQKNILLCYISKTGKITGYVSTLDEIHTENNRNVKIIQNNDILGLIKKFASKQKKKKIGLNYDKISHRIFLQINKICKSTDISKDIKLIRRRKNKKEIDTIKKACKKTDKVFDKILSLLNRGYRPKNEQELKGLIKSFIKIENGKESFETIVASGKNASIPHYEKFGKLKKGFCILDFGIKYKNYCSDMSRTLYFGKPTKKEIEIYDLVLKTQEKAIKMCVPGTKVSEIDTFVRNSLGKYSKYFIHSLGHGIGVEVHEDPRVSNKSDEVLMKDDVITIEPGLYKNFGIRIEDDVLVDKKPKILTKSSKELLTFSINPKK